MLDENLTDQRGSTSSPPRGDIPGACMSPLEKNNSNYVTAQTSDSWQPWTKL